MNIGSNFYTKQIARKAKLPKNVKVITKFDEKSEESSAELCVFSPEKNKKFSTRRIFIPCRFDTIKKIFVPFKTDVFYDIKDKSVLVHR